MDNRRIAHQTTVNKKRINGIRNHALLDTLMKNFGIIISKLKSLNLTNLLHTYSIVGLCMFKSKSHLNLFLSIRRVRNI